VLTRQKLQLEAELRNLTGGSMGLVMFECIGSRGADEAEAAVRSGAA